MGLHQINVGHMPEQDRLLVRINTTDKVEFRLWLTRRIVKGLWTGLLQLMQSAEPVRAQAAPQSKAAVMEFQHEKALSESRFGGKYEGEQLTPALPGEPLLVARVKLNSTPGSGHTLVFLPKEGAGFTVQFNDRLLHAFAKLIRDGAEKAGWDLALSLPVSAVPANHQVN